PAAGGSQAGRPAPSRPAAARPGSAPLQPGPSRRPATGRGGSHVGPAPARPAAAVPRSALGADFRRSVGSTASLTPEVPARTTPLDQWHVAINDVPVGPMRRDEISRKIAT